MDDGDISRSERWMMISALIGMIVAAALAFCDSARAADAANASACSIRAGLSGERYRFHPFERDGAVQARLGYGCDVAELPLVGVLALRASIGASYGVVIDSAAFGGRDTLQADIGVVGVGPSTIGVGLHWITGEPLDRSTSYGATAQIGVPLDSILTLLGDDDATTTSAGMPPSLVGAVR